MSLKTNPSAKLPKFAQSKDELADLLGVSRSTVQRSSALPGAPKTKANGGYSVEAWKAHIKQHWPTLLEMEKPGAAVPEGFTSWKEYGDAQKSQREAIKLAQDKREVASKPFVAAVISQGYNKLVAAQQRVFLSELPSQIAGLDAVTIETRLKEALNTSHEEFRRSVSEWENPTV